MATSTHHERDRHLGDILREMDDILIAFSGGVDSTFLAARAREEVGKERVLAVISSSDTFPEREFNEAVSLCDELDLHYKTIHVEELANENFAKNGPDRCYHCRIGMMYLRNLYTTSCT